MAIISPALSSSSLCAQKAEILEEFIPGDSVVDLILSYDDDLAEKAKVVGEFFKGVVPDFHTVARNETQIAELILSYTGDAESFEKEQLVYHPPRLQRAFAKRNRENPLKSKALVVIDIESPDARKMVMDTLKIWQSIASDKYTKLSVAQTPDDSLELQRSIKSKMNFYRTLEGMITFLEASDSITVVLDEKSTLQAICSSYASDKVMYAWHVDLLITAPHNAPFEDEDQNPKRVTGAGSALIEAAVLKSIKRQGLNSKNSLTFEAMKNTAVVLDAVNSEKFYRNLFFEKIPSGIRDMLILKGNNPFQLRNILILQGENLFRFLQEYGGRAQIKI